MIVKEIQASSCLTKSKLTDYVINPYTGCQHGCKYCYATFIKRFQNIKEEWGEFVHAKVNCPQLLGAELEKNPDGHIWMSSVTDPYQPLEARYKLTLQILQTILDSKHRNKFTIEILTKSALVKRDLNIIKELGAELGFSINTLNPEVTRAIEPFASLPSARIAVLKEAKEKGIPVFGFISPILPGITDLEELFKELQFCDYVWLELLNTKKDVLERMLPLIKKKFADKLKDFEDYIKDPENFYFEVKENAKRLEKKYGLKIKEIVIHPQR